LWQARLGSSVTNGPISYQLDGLQYLIVGAGDTLWAFVMNEPMKQGTSSSRE
jgi:alcohol dehydrogenase (cytochrome c)